MVVLIPHLVAIDLISLCLPLLNLHNNLIPGDKVLGLDSFTLLLFVIHTTISDGITRRFIVSFGLLLTLLVTSSLINDETSTNLLTVITPLFCFLSVAFFPPLTIPKPSGCFKVGVIDTYLKKEGKPIHHRGQSHIKIRILYPAASPSGKGIIGFVQELFKKTDIDYQEKGETICDKFLLFGGPPALRPYGWLLHFWLLIRPKFIANATLLSLTEYNKVALKSGKDNKLRDVDNGYPVVLYSHGLFGNNAMYSVQAGNLASKGYVVIMVDHLDGSAPMSTDQDGKTVDHEVELYSFRSNSPKPGFDEWDTPDYVAARRIQNLKRVEEYLEVSNRILTWNKKDEVFVNGNIPPSKVFSFKGMLDTRTGVHGMGHSYGGCTMLTSASRKPQNFRSIVAHDPAVDWVAEDARRHIEHAHKSGYTGGRPYLEPNGVLRKGLDELPCFFLYCSDWIERQWGHSPIVIDKV